MSRKQVQEEVFNSLSFPVHGLINLPPRFGKTKLGIDIIKKQKPKRILWVTPSIKLRDIDIPEEFIKWRAKTYLKKADIVCYSSLSKVAGEYDIVVLDINLFN